jgi:hypothetical protein
MRKYLSKKLIVWVVVCLSTYTLLGFFILPLIAKPVLKDRLARILNREVLIERIKINPFALSITIVGLEIKKSEGKETLASWSELYVNLQSISLFKRALIAKELRLIEPYLSIERDVKGTLNIMTLFEKAETDSQQKNSNDGKNDVSKDGSPEKGLAIRADTIELVGGKILFSDQSAPEAFQTTLSPVSLYLINLNTTGEGEALFKLSMKSEIDEDITIDGNLFLDPFISQGHVEAKGLSATKYSPYYNEKIAFTVEDGTLNLGSDYRYDGRKESSTAELSNLNISLKKALLKQENVEFFKVDTFLIEDTDFNLIEKTIDIGTVATSDGTLNLARSSTGTLNVSTLVPQAGSDEEPDEEAADAPPWVVTLKTLSTDGYTVTFKDQSTAQPAKITLKDIELKGENISTAEKSRGQLILDFQEELGGTLSFTGTVGVNPLFADIALNISDFSITPFQPYVSEGAALIIQKGSFTTKGSLLVTDGAENTPSIIFKSDVTLSDFSSVDSAKGDEFFNCSSLRFNELELSYNPNMLKTGNIILSDFYTRLIIKPDQTLNITDIFKGNNEETKVPAKKKEEKKEDISFFESVDLGTLQLENGHINFSDRFIKPNYTANLFEIEGKISGLTSVETTLADVDLRGKLDKTVPLKITGKTNPLKEDFFADLKIEFENIDLSPLTPYAKKYLGYSIDKGNLFLNLTYIIDKRKIDSQNRIFLDQFTLGKAHKSPDAIKLPVGLAISLLQNRKGEIDLDVPVSGSLDDPEFSVGYFIFKIIVNIIEKAITAPFALLGSLAGGGEELGYIEFDYGSSVITKENVEKLEKLDEALFERPLLKLEIEGHVDIEKDREILRRDLFNKKIRAAKLKDTVDRGQTPLPLEEIEIKPDEYEKYLVLAYEAEGLPEVKGEEKTEEMERMLFNGITVTDDDLRHLAYERASRIKDYILASGKVEKERIFLIEPKNLLPEKRETVRDSRVVFNLK